MIGSFGDILFNVSEYNVFTLKEELKRTRRARISEHNPIYGVSTLRHQGRELIEVTFSVELLSTITPMPGLQAQRFKEYVETGRYEPLIIGLHTMSEFPFIVTEVEETMSYFNSLTGDFDKIVLDVTLKEYVDNPTYYQTKAAHVNKKIPILETGEKDKIETEQDKKVNTFKK